MNSTVRGKETPSGFLLTLKFQNDIIQTMVVGREILGRLLRKVR